MYLLLYCFKNKHMITLYLLLLLLMFFQSIILVGMHNEYYSKKLYNKIHLNDVLAPIFFSYILRISVHCNFDI